MRPILEAAGAAAGELRICHEELIGRDRELHNAERRLRNEQEARAETLRNMELVLANEPVKQIAGELDDGLWAGRERFWQ